MAFFAVISALVAAAPGNHNVLMITIDDLRPQLHHAYGMTETLTPNLDKFSEGLLPQFFLSVPPYACSLMVMPPPPPPPPPHLYRHR